MARLITACPWGDTALLSTASVDLLLKKELSKASKNMVIYQLALPSFDPHQRNSQEQSRWSLALPAGSFETNLCSFSSILKKEICQAGWLLTAVPSHSPLPFYTKEVHPPRLCIITRGWLQQSYPGTSQVLSAHQTPNLMVIMIIPLIF